YRSSILLLCDNPFRSFIATGLRNAGAIVDVASCVNDASRETPYDAIVVALKPQASPVVSAADAFIIASHWPGAVIAQFWGDIERAVLEDLDIPVWPRKAPALGHMGVLPSALGPVAVLR